MASRESMIPSPFPPFAGWSYTASAANPLGVADGGCGVKLPNSCLPVVDESIGTGQSKESVVGAGSRPAHLDRRTRATDVKTHTVGRVGQRETLPADVNDDWRDTASRVGGAAVHAGLARRVT